MNNEFFSRNSWYVDASCIAQGFRAVSIEASQGKYGSMLLQNSQRTDTNIDKHSL